MGGVLCQGSHFVLISPCAARLKTTRAKAKTSAHTHIPICSMYRICISTGPENHPNVGESEYTIHGAHGIIIVNKNKKTHAAKVTNPIVELQDRISVLSAQGLISCMQVYANGGFLKMVVPRNHPIVRRFESFEYQNPSF